MWRRMVDTAERSDGGQWEDRTCPGCPAPVPAVPGQPIDHIRVDDDVVLAAEHDLTGPLRDLVSAVITVGGEVLAVRDERWPQHGRVAGRWLPPAGLGKLGA
jgi:hypothetical protein